MGTIIRHCWWNQNATYHPVKRSNQYTYVPLVCNWKSMYARYHSLSWSVFASCEWNLLQNTTVYSLLYEWDLRPRAEGIISGTYRIFAPQQYRSKPLSSVDHCRPRWPHTQQHLLPRSPFSFLLNPAQSTKHYRSVWGVLVISSNNTNLIWQLLLLRKIDWSCCCFSTFTRHNKNNTPWHL